MTKIAEFANSVHLNEVAHQDLHCLPSSLWILNMLYLGFNIFWKFADENFVVCFSVVKDLGTWEMCWNDTFRLKLRLYIRVYTCLLIFSSFHDCLPYLAFVETVCNLLLPSKTTIHKKWIPAETVPMILHKKWIPAETVPMILHKKWIPAETVPMILHKKWIPAETVPWFCTKNGFLLRQSPWFCFSRLSRKQEIANSVGRCQVWQLPQEVETGRPVYALCLKAQIFKISSFTVLGTTVFTGLTE